MWSRIRVCLVAALAIGAASCSKDVEKMKRDFLASGDRYVAQENYAEAIIQYRNAVALDSSLGPARFKLAEAYAQSGDPRNALREYVRAADLMPNDLEAQLRAGNGLLAAGQFPEAKTRALAALAKDSKNVRAIILMGNAMAGMKDLDGAISQVQDAIDADPRETLVYTNLGGLQMAKGDRAAAEAAFKRAVEIDPKSETAHLALANFYWTSRDYPQCERELKTALEINPKSISANRAAALFYSITNRSDQYERYLVAYATLDSTTPGPTLILADSYLLQRRVDDARKVLAPLLATKNGFIPAKLRMAAIDFHTGARPEAYRALDEVFKREPMNEDALLEKVRFLMVERKPNEALKLAEQALKANPKSVAGLYLKGSALKAMGSLESAAAAFQDALKLSPTVNGTLVLLAETKMELGDYAAAVEFASESLKRDPRATLPHLIRARSLLRLGQLVLAEPEIVGLAKAIPDSADVQLLAGDFYWAKNDVTRARAAYERALNLPGGAVPALANLVNVEVRLGKLDNARSMIAAQLAKTPDNEQVLLLAGSLFRLTGNDRDAEAAFQHVLRVNPSSLNAYSQLGALYGSQNRFDDARKEYEEIASRNPKASVMARTMVGTILSLQGKDEDARKEYERILALDPRAPIAANNLAWDYAESGQNLDVALNLAQTAKARLPDVASVTDTLGWVYYKKGLVGLAVSSLEEAVKQAPSEPRIKYHLGLAYLKSGDTKRARDSFEQALKLKSDFKEAADAKKVLATLKG
jgi:tetratricopeptide (TPR) repeat protein